MSKTLEAQGGNGGTSFDDRAFEGVRKVYVGQGEIGVSYVKFDYDNGGETDTRDHGNITVLGAEEFAIEYPEEYITSVEGTYEKVLGSDSEVITSLTFKTSKGRTSQPFGIESGTRFVLEEKGSEIVGFHGSASDVIHQIGVHVVQTDFEKLQGKWIKLKQKGTGPGERSSHAIAVVGDKMYSFGGEFRPNGPLDNILYVFDLKTQTWSIAPATGEIPPLNLIGLCMVSVGTNLYVFGGRDNKRKYSGFYSYDTLTNEWKLLTPLGEGPEARSYHSMTADDKNVYVFGGVSTTARVKTLHAYNVEDGSWKQLPSPDEPVKPRGAPGLAVVDGKIWVVYGCDGCEAEDVHFFDLKEGKWTTVETKGVKPSPRSVFATAVVGKHIVIFGGEIKMDPRFHLGPGKLSGGTFALNTETFEWRKLDKRITEEEEERPGPRGWGAFASVRFRGHDGLLMYGGNTPTNDRVGDIFFFSPNFSA